MVDEFLHLCDCAEIGSIIEPNSVDLVYADPPFKSGKNRQHSSGKFSDKWKSMDEYIDFMRERLEAISGILSPRGSIYLHCDDRMSHRLRCLMDEIFGTSAYRSHINWKRSNAKGDATRAFGRISDHILHYARKGATFNPQYTSLNQDHIDKKYIHDDHDGRGKYMLGGLVNPQHGKYKYEWRGYKVPERGWSCPEKTMQKRHDEGRLHYPKDRNSYVYLKCYLSESQGTPVGNTWHDIKMLPPTSPERVKYPTQKPIELLTRIILASSNEGDLVFDPFMGSGTTLIAAKRLGRRYGGCDNSMDSIRTTRQRLEMENEN